VEVSALKHVIINPGTGPVDGATVDNAYDNMRALLADAGHPEVKWCRDVDADEEGGRFAFSVTVQDPETGRDAAVTVDMPGCRLSLLTGSLLTAPRIYVDGSSWWWEFAVDRIRERVEGDE
jgi:hypothetical protein